MADSRPKDSKRRGFKFYLSVTLVLTAGFLAACVVIARRPDYSVSFVREVPTTSTPEALNQAMWAISNWPSWFFTMADVKRVDISGNLYSMKEQTLEEGALIRFSIDPKKGRHRRFELQGRVTRYVPQKLVSLQITHDSSGRLTQLFDRLEWTIELLPAEGGLPARIRGTATAMTRHWRSRLFGVLSERILMHQVFYPDLLKLEEVTQPLSPDSLPLHQK